MKKRYGMESVEITPTVIKIRRGLRSFNIMRSALIGVEVKPLTGKIIFVTAKKRYKVVLWHGIKDIKQELGL